MLVDRAFNGSMCPVFSPEILDTSEKFVTSSIAAEYYQFCQSVMHPLIRAELAAEPDSTLVP